MSSAKRLSCCLQQVLHLSVCNLSTLLNLTDPGAYAGKHTGRRRAGSYGSTKRYKSFERLVRVNDVTVLGAGGELSDFQYIQTLLDELATEDYCADDGIQLTPREVYAYLSRVLYNRRNKHAAPASSAACHLHASITNMLPVHRMLPASLCPCHRHACVCRSTAR